IAERGERATVEAVTGDEAFGLFDEAAIEHRCSALIDAFVKTFARWIETEAQDTVAGESVPAFLPLLGERPFGGGRDFNRGDSLGHVVGVNGRCGGSVETHKDTVQVGRTAGLTEVAQAFPLAWLPGWGRK